MGKVDRERLRWLLQDRGRSARDVSLKAKLGATAVKDILNGKSRDPGLSTLAAIAAELGASIDDLTDGLAVDATNQDVRIIPQPLPVRYRVRAGSWIENDSDEPIEQTAHAVAPNLRYAQWPQWLELIVGDSANLRVPAGTYVHVVDAIQMGYAPRQGHWVIVERRRDGGRVRERTLKQINIRDDGAVELWPRSTNPLWQEPICLTDGARAGEDIEVEIVGRVIGAYDPAFD